MRYFALNDGLLTDPNVYGYGLSGTETWMTTISSTIIPNTYTALSPIIISEGQSIDALAVHVDSRADNPTGTLGVNIQRNNSIYRFEDKSSYNATVNTFGTPFKSFFSPCGLNGWSGYFNGSSSVLGPTNDSNFIFRTNNFTIECWVYPTIAPGNWTPILTIGMGGASSGVNQGKEIRIGYGVSSTGFYGIVSPNVNNVSDYYTNAGSALPLNSWSHLALVRNISGMYLYRNGVRVLSANANFDFNPATLRVKIGTGQDEYTTDGSFTGYISNLRVVKGTALYTSNFTPSVSPLTNIDNTSLLCLQNPSLIKDYSSNNLALKTGGTPTIKQTSPFTEVQYTYDPTIHGSCADLNASPDYLTVKSNINLAYQPFTIEGWFHSDVAYTNQIIFGITNAAAGPMIRLYTTSSNLYLDTGTASASLVIPTVANYLVPNSWCHIALVKEGNYVSPLKLYTNGTLVTSVTLTSYGLSGITGPFGIGYDRYTTGATYFNGKIANFAILSGAKYLSSFIPALSVPVNDENTSFLLNSDRIGTVLSSTSDSYNISDFTKYQARYPTALYSPNWQTLKLKTSLQPSSGEVLMLKLSASDANQLSLVGTNTVVDISNNHNRPYISGTGVANFSNNKPSSSHYDSFFLTRNTEWIVSPPSYANFVFDDDFTIECWLRTADYSVDGSAHSRIWGFGAVAANNLECILYNGGVSNLPCVYMNGVTIQGTTPVANGSWNHIAVVRYRNLLKLYVNGVQSGASYNTSNTNYNLGIINPLSIGSYGNSAAGRFLSAFVNDFRIVKGEAVYKTNFVPPSAAPLEVTDKTVLLLRPGFNYSKSLISYNPDKFKVPYTFNTVSGYLSSSLVPFGSGGSLLLSGTGTNISNYVTLSTPSVYTDIGTSDFTLEGWFYLKYNTIGYQFFMTIGDYSADIRSGVSMYTETNNQLRVVGTTNGSAWNVGFNYTSVLVPTVSTWHHMAVVRTGNLINAYYDGSLYAWTSLANDTALYTTTNTKIYYGYYLPTAARTFAGLLAYPRFSRRALYTINTIDYNSVPLDDNSLLWRYPYAPTTKNLPPSLDDVIISGNLYDNTNQVRTITADTTAISDLYIENDGMLIFDPISSKDILIHGSFGLQIASEGTLNMGTSSTPILSSSKNSITLSNSQINVHDYGYLNIYGANKTQFAYLSNGSSATNRTFYSSTNISNWLSGDRLIFVRNTTSNSSTDTLVLSAVTNPYVFKTTLSTTYAHNTYFTAPDVVNMSRNVKILGSTSTIRFYDAAQANIYNAEINLLGANFLNYAPTSILYLNNSAANVMISGCALSGLVAAGIDNLAFTFAKRVSSDVVQNINIYNNNIANFGLNSAVLYLSSISAYNVNFAGNAILNANATKTGIVVTNLYGDKIDITNNYVIGQGYGYYLQNNYSTNFKIGGVNYGNDVGAVLTGAKIDTNYINNLGCYYNTIDGFVLSGYNSLFSPAKININGLKTNNNGGIGFNALCITGNITGLEASGNNVYNANISIGNGVTKINGLTSINAGWRSTVIVANSSSIVHMGSVALSTCSPANDGSKSLYFNGATGSMLMLSAQSVYNLYPNVPYTFEAWIYHIASSNYACILGQRTLGNNSGYGFFLVPGTGILTYYVGTTNYQSSNAPAKNEWEHIAYVYDGVNVNLYLNGVKVHTFAVNPLDMNEPLTIGAIRSSSGLTNEHFFTGYMNNVRFVRGYQVYTKNFVPSTSPLKTIPNTLLLLQYPAAATNINTFTSLSSYDRDFYGLRILSGMSFSDVSISNAYLKNPYPLYLDSTKFEQFNLESSFLSGSDSQDIIFDNTNNSLEGSYAFHNNKFNSQHIVDQLADYQSDGYQETGMSFMRHQSLSGNHFKVVRSGKISIDKTFGYTAAKVSEKLEPYSYSNTIPLRSSVKRIPINYGEFTSISVYIYKSITPNYDGTPPRLILRQNSSIGYSYTVLATSAEPNGVWEKLYATLPFATNDGVMEVYVECSAASGYVSVDYWNF